MAFSGRMDGSTSSHLGPPTAPNSTASAAWHASIVSCGNGSPKASIAAPPAFFSIQLAVTPALAKAASTTARAEFVISSPMPSPAIRTICFSLIVFLISIFFII